MIIKFFFLSFITIFFSSNAFSSNIRVVDFQKIIESNINMSLLYEQIDEDQLIYKKKFKNEEIILQSELEEIEKLNLILDPSEIAEEIEKYNFKLKNFNQNIEKFNLHYDMQINNLKNKIIKITLEILKKYSEDNNIDLILDSNNYILSSNTINITDIIINQLNKKTIEINFEKYSSN
ncbi:OmpH family outer membrane protein [Alphaproteobacteria bacterium]|nr:OmpH family outer membrane protein [Alphaproteobacteria bacterium]